MVSPRLLFGRVAHFRKRPAHHGFVYPVFCLRVPLSQIDALAGPLFGVDRFNLFSFKRRDFGPRDGTSLETWARKILADGHVAEADGEIVLQAFPRMLGYAFNPIGIWYCHDRAGQLRAVICEVSNTFGEHHNYLVAHGDRRPIAPGDWLTAAKAFHVSPFCEVEGHYRFRFTERGEHHTARIDYHDRDGPLLVTSISGDEREITTGLLARTFIAYPFMTLFVIGRIHWHALRLWAKRVPWFRKPEPPLQETTR
ncbi:hypothetical protein DSM104443_00643 [Usitatibacter rugosus]|uniref:DUF1365 domain-containing protein n=1 Tax=Usitatibacter rugosus TaxID=2732067 RepID=A0A6M4GSZ2_9PROT|nr:hypothetical protein DSM104443_00643 [Usitatibacter rugosus]